MFDLLEEINAQHGTKLGLRIGIDAGAVVAGVLGGSKFMYNVWGKTVTTAAGLNAQADNNSLLISDTVYERLEEREQFVSRPNLALDGVGSIPPWLWSKDG